MRCWQISRHSMSLLLHVENVAGLIVWRCERHRWFVAGIIRTAQQLWHNNIQSVCTKNFTAEWLAFFLILEVPGLNFEPQTDSSDNVSAILHSTSRLKSWKCTKNNPRHVPSTSLSLSSSESALQSKPLQDSKTRPFPQHHQLVSWAAERLRLTSN